MSQKPLFFLIAGLAVLAALVYCFISNLADDQSIDMQELIGLVFLTFVAVGAIFAIILAGFSELIFRWMEGRGDALSEAGRSKQARQWYRRCLWLDDTLRNGSWKRVVIMGKISRLSGDPGESGFAGQSSGKEEPGKESVEPSQDFEQTVSPVIARSWVYRYAFILLFGVIAVVYAMTGSTGGAMTVFFVGVGLNVYWLVSQSP